MMKENTSTRLRATLEKLGREVDRLRKLARDTDDPEIAVEVAQIADQLAKTINEIRAAASLRFGGNGWSSEQHSSS